LKLDELLLLIPLAVSIVSIIIAGMSYNTSRKALRLSESEHDEKKLPIISYLIDSFSFDINNENYCFFAVSYTNQSSLQQSFKHLELEIDFIDIDGMHGKSTTFPCHEIFPPAIYKEYKKLQTPLNLQAKETVSGWITFKIPTCKHRKVQVQSYRVIGITSDGKFSKVESFLLRHITNE
jgi:hypothetical protein